MDNTPKRPESKPSFSKPTSLKPEVKAPEIFNPLAKDKVYKKFLKLFRLQINPEGGSTGDQIVSTVPVFDKETGRIDKFFPEQMPDKVKALKDWYLNSTQSKEENWKNRQKLWQDMYLLPLNSPYLARAMQTVVDETLQVDAGNSQPIMVEAKKRQKEFILKFFDKIKLYNKIPATTMDYVKYGNAVWILGLDETGIYDIEHINIRQFDDRMEFTPYKVKEIMNSPGSHWYNIMKDYSSNVRRVDQLIKSIQNKENIMSYFKSYLFGYVIGGECLPPWRVIHFRNATTESPFAPFGVPMFINSLAPTQRLETATTMKIIAQGMMFPRNVYEIDLPNVISPTEKFSQAVEFANLWHNSGLNSIKKEQDGIGETIFTIKGLYEYRQESPEIDIDKLGLGDALINEVVVSTMLPRNLIDPNDSSFGDSGVSLTEKFKPFARLVYRVQSAILEGVTQAVKIHMIQSRQFSLEEIDFSLSMPYPESQVNRDLIDNQSALLGLSNDLITALSTQFFGGQPVPKELSKLVYNKFLPYDDYTIKQWINVLDKEEAKRQQGQGSEVQGAVGEQGEETPETGGPELGSTPSPAEDLFSKETPESQGGPETPESYKRGTKRAEGVNRSRTVGRLYEHDIYARLDSRIKSNPKLQEAFNRYEGDTTQEKINNFIFDFKQKSLREGKINKEHYFSSKNINPDFDIADLLVFDKQILTEEFVNDRNKIKELQEEETTYHFTPLEEETKEEGEDHE